MPLGCLAPDFWIICCASFFRGHGARILGFPTHSSPTPWTLPKWASRNSPKTHGFCMDFCWHHHPSSVNEVFYSLPCAISDAQIREVKKWCQFWTGTSSRELNHLDSTGESIPCFLLPPLSHTFFLTGHVVLIKHVVQEDPQPKLQVLDSFRNRPTARQCWV